MGSNQSLADNVTSDRGQPHVAGTNNVISIEGWRPRY